MMPLTLPEQPPAYLRAQSRLGRTLHIDTLTSPKRVLAHTWEECTL